jgi:phosphomannomutase/phosphoglucomutase
MKDIRKHLDAPRGTVFALTIAILVAGTLLANVVIGYAWTLEQRTRRAHGEAVAAQAAAGLQAYAALLRAHTAQLGRQGGRPDCTARSPAPGCTGDAIPALESLQFVALGPLGIAASDFDPAALYNHVEVNLVGGTFGGSTASAVEAINADGRWLLVAAARVEPGAATPGGVLVARAPLEAVLKDVLLAKEPQGEFSLHGGGLTQPLARSGAAPAAGAETYTAATIVPSLQAGFTPGEAFLEATAVSGAGLVLPVFAGTGLVIVLVLFGFRQLHNQLRADAAKLTDAALYQRTSTLSAPVLYYAELTPLGEALVQVRKDAASASRRPRDETRKPVSSVADPLEIELLEETATIPSPEAAPSLDELYPAEVFRDYDVRGHDSLLRPELAFALGQAVGAEALERGCRTLVVGADGRETSPMLREQLVRGLLASGVDVVDIGTVATPMLYFACHALGTQSGVMVTGSHNAADHNGFKIMLGGETLCGARIAALRTRIIEGRLSEGTGSYRSTSINEDYRRAVCDDVLVDRPFRVVIDCGNGAASVVAVELLQELGCEVTPLYCDIDPRFPNHAPDPSAPANLRQLLSEVSAQRADLGIAFDGDGDRIGVVTANGRVVAADRLMMLFARELLSRHPGADVVFDVKCSRDLAAEITRNGGRPIMCRSGHSWIKEKMKETGALLGGEFTGHICFKDRWYGFDDALYCSARLLEVLSAESQTLDELLDALPRAIGTPEILLRVPEERKFAMMDTVSKGLDLEGARLTRIDGVRAEFADGWGLVRASNTTAALTLRFEARDERALARIQGAFREKLHALLPDCELTF